MFTRISKIKAGGKVYEYLRIVENYKKKGKTCQRVISNLGRVSDLIGKLDGIVEKLRDYCKEKFVKQGEVDVEEAPIWGPTLVAKRIWDEIGIGEIIRNRCSGTKKRAFAIEDIAFVLVASSFTNPCSEHGLGWWLDNSYICDSKGGRFVTRWREDVTKDDRVRVKWEQLNTWYRGLDILINSKDKIEYDIYLRLRDLFGLKVDVVFYDITSLYFEGEGPEELARYGKSKDGKGRNKQILLGIVMASGWPVAHHIFSGNTGESKTVKGIIEDLKHRFEIEKLVFVGDAGILSEENIGFIGSSGYKYIIAMKRRRSKEVDIILNNIGDRWEESSKGTVVQEVKVEGMRYIVAKSNERQVFEESIRKNNMESTRKKLEKLKAKVSSGKLKKQEKIGYKASTILNKVKGYRYFSWEITKDGGFNYWEDNEKIAREKLIEGLYIVKTNDKDMQPVRVINSYKELTDVEGAFREFKDVLEGRPIYHQTADRVKAHVFVKALAYLLHTALKKKMDKAGINLAIENAVQSLGQVKIADLRLRGEKHQIIFGAKGYARRILNAVGLTKYKDLLPQEVFVKKCDKMS